MATGTERVGVLLVNLGTPEAPTPQAVRAYLKPFLSDRRVIDYPRWLWYPILYGIILPLRSRKVAKNYQAIWGEGGSPLRVNTLRLTEQIQQVLGPDIPVSVGMTYGEPSVESGVKQLLEQGCERLLIVPLFPQYSSTTTAAVYDALHQVFTKSRFVPQMRMVNDYYRQPGYVKALAASVRDSWRQQGIGQNSTNQPHLLMSFHGIPERYVRTGDPYQQQCEYTAQALAKELGLTAEQWTLSYQSRVGKEPWLGPDTESCLQQLAQKGVKHVSVISPAFATDCLETLDELANEAQEVYLEAGGESFTYVPALNDSQHHVALLTDVIAQEAQGWFTLHPIVMDEVAG